MTSSVYAALTKLCEGGNEEVHAGTGLSGTGLAGPSVGPEARASWRSPVIGKETQRSRGSWRQNPRFPQETMGRGVVSGCPHGQSPAGFERQAGAIKLHQLCLVSFDREGSSQLAELEAQSHHMGAIIYGRGAPGCTPCREWNTDGESRKTSARARPAWSRPRAIEGSAGLGSLPQMEQR